MPLLRQKIGGKRVARHVKRTDIGTKGVAEIDQRRAVQDVNVRHRNALPVDKFKGASDRCADRRRDVTFGPSAQERVECGSARQDQQAETCKQDCGSVHAAIRSGELGQRAGGMKAASLDRCLSLALGVINAPCLPTCSSRTPHDDPPFETGSVECSRPCDAVAETGRTPCGRTRTSMARATERQSEMRSAPENKPPILHQPGH